MKQTITFTFLEQSFPEMIRTIKVYIGMNQDFERLCKDFEEVSETLQLLRRATHTSKGYLQSQIESNVQLQKELKFEIESFIYEEEKNANNIT